MAALEVDQKLVSVYLSVGYLHPPRSACGTSLQSWDHSFLSTRSVRIALHVVSASVATVVPHMLTTYL